MGRPVLYLTLEAVTELHHEQLALYGGLAGVRDSAALESALAQPQQVVFGQELHVSLFDKAAAYCFHLAQNHPFSDGNKRTAYSSAHVFLRCNGWLCDGFTNDEVVDLMNDVAQGRNEKPELAALFAARSRLA